MTHLQEINILFYLDAMSGFHQLKLHESSKDITSSSTLTRHYQFTLLPFGLTNAPQQF